MTEAKKKVSSSKIKAVGKKAPVKKVTEKPTKEAKVKKEAKDGIDQKSPSSEVQADKQGAKEVAGEKPEVAKAGKRSAKALKETEVKAEKEARKSDAKTEDLVEKPKDVPKPPRSRLQRRSKNYRKVSELIDKSKIYDLKEALDLAIKTSPIKFDATVELHINLNVDPKQADQNIRGTVLLPAGTGKSARVAVFGEPDEVAAAKKAGADIAAGDEFLQQLDKELINFDVLIASPKVMGRLGKYAKLLGPKGLMPNPKSGTVTTDVAKAVSEAKAGRVEYRVDSSGIIHVGTGKVSFGTDKLGQNTEAVIASIKAAKPATIKGTFIKSAYLTTSMGPSIKLSL